jgi:UDP-glucose 4-epimerase
MRLFVTGGAGYVGSVVVEHLVRDGHEIVVFDDFSTGHRGAVPAGVTVRSGDLRDPEAVVRALEPGTDAVLHFASRSIVPDSMRDPVGYWEHNVGGAMSLLRAVAAARVGRFVFSSSAAVYGEAVEQPIPESAPTRPTHPYGATKRAIEMLLEDSSRTTGLRIACLRYFNAAGASRQRGEDHRPETHLIPRLVRAALSPGTSVPLYGTDYPTPDGTCLRDYVHVSDLADAHLRAVDALLEGGPGGPYNLGTGEGRSNLEVLRAVGAVVGRPVPYREGPRRDGDPAELVADSSRFRRDFAWSPVRSDLDTILRTAWAWLGEKGTVLSS